jgi:UDP-GlcNAc:undecaprenyl-phosphate GlcNAc-1-phosphate transferase
MPSWISFAVAFATALVLTPPGRWLALRLNFVDRPAARKVHVHPIPLGGGIMITAGMLAGAMAGGLAGMLPREMWAVLSGLGWIVALGVVDDRWSLPPLIKLLGQVAAALMLIIGSGHPAPTALGGFGVPMALVGSVGLMNACNFLDNMDGILGGIGLLCGVGLAWAASATRPEVAALCAATAGAAGGFLVYNFHPARIFMGDAGSHAIGFLLAAGALLLVPYSLPVVESAGLLLVIAYPLFDLVFVTVTRVQSGRPVWSPGKDHTTHRLNRLLESPRLTALAVYALTAVAVAAGIALLHRPGVPSAVAAAAPILLFLILGLRLARVASV